MLLASILMLLIFDVRLTRKNIEVLKKIELKNVKKIAIECFPLAISTIVSMYVINVVKYAIDMNGNNTLQTYFNILYIPYPSPHKPSPPNIISIIIPLIS